MKKINVKRNNTSMVMLAPMYQTGGGLPMGLPNVGGMIAGAAFGTPDTKGEKIGAGIGAGLDPLLNLVAPGLGQLGVGRLAGQAVGSLFPPDTSGKEAYDNLNNAMRVKKNDISNPYGASVYREGGGIHIKPENRGKFTAYKQRTGKTTEEALHSKNPHVRQMANFARNAAKWHHANGGDVEPQYEAEDNEVVIKQHPGEQVNMHGTGKLVDESSYAGTIKGDTHEEGGEDMSGGEYILSDKKTLDYLDAGKRNGKSVAALARPLVKKIKDSEDTTDLYKRNALDHHVSQLEKIKQVFNSNKEKHELIDSFLTTVNIQDKKELASHKNRLLEGLKTGDITLDDLKSAVNDTKTPSEY